MPWKESSRMSSRLEFVMLASAPDVNMQALCQSFGVSRKTGYKWLDLYRKHGEAGLEDRSRRPHSSPRRSNDKLEAEVLACTRSTRAGAHASSKRCCLRRSGSLIRTRSLPYCAVMAGNWCRTSTRPIRQGNALNTTRRTACGRWTSKGIFP